MNPLEQEGQSLDCVANSLAFTHLRPDLESTPIPEVDADYFVERSCFRDQLGYHVGYSVVKKQNEDFVTVISQHCKQLYSAQLAEL